jgi:cation-transporting ATPase I
VSLRSARDALTAAGSRLWGRPFAPRRRVQVSDGRAVVEVRGLHRPGTEAIADEVERALTRLRGVHWAEVNAVLGQVVLALDDEADAEDIVAVLDGIEAASDLHRDRSPFDRADHPGDTAALHRQLAALAGDAGAIVLGATGRAAGFGGIPGPVGAVVALVEATPRLRRGLEARLGHAGADLGLALASAVTQGFGQSPYGTVADAVQRVELIREAVARRRVWEAREPDLHGRSCFRARPVEVVSRPRPLPAGPVERYADASGAVAVAAAGAALLVTRHPGRAEAVLRAATPKAARMTREAYAAEVDRRAAHRGVVTMDTRALRRLDRIDTVVLEAEVLHTGRYVVGATEVLEENTSAVGGDADALGLQAMALLDPARPTTVRHDGAWTLEPVPTGTRDLRRRARRIARPGASVLALLHDGCPVALVAAEPELDPLATAVVGAARAVGDLVVAGVRSGEAERLRCRAVRTGTRLAGEIRALQEEGRGVVLVARRGAAALAAADCGIGVLVDGRPVPWGAHLLAGPGLAEVHLLLQATVEARGVSRRGAMLALGGSALGAFLGLLAPAAGASDRVQVGVHGAALAGMAAGGWTARRVGRRRVPTPAPSTPWHALTAEATMRDLGTSPAGLPEQTAVARRTGRARAPEEAPPGVVGAAAEELANPLTPVLAVGAGLAAAAGSVLDAAMITSVMGLNALVGGVQRVGADRAVRRLTAATAARVLLRRDGGDVDAPADELVPGDIVVLRAGDTVPADCRVVESRGVEVDESSLTGESRLVAKSVDPTAAAAVAERRSMLYAGTTVAAGRALGAVVATGPETVAGRSAATSADDTKPAGGVQARLEALTRRTVPISLAAGAALLGAGMLRGRPLQATLGEGVGLAVAAVPEGLPVVATVAQLGAARRLSRRGALVRNASTVEALGRVGVLCFDKTGTLTEGRLSVHRVTTAEAEEDVGALGREGRRVLAAGLRASPRQRGGRTMAHPTDQAVVSAAEHAGVTTDEQDGTWERVDALPFEPARGYHAALGRTAAGHRIAVKGAPEVVLPRCSAWQRDGVVVPFDLPSRAAVEADVERLARTGHRVLAVAERPASDRSDLTDSRVQGLTFRGLLGLSDPVRPTAAAAVATVRSAGVDVVMVTGDHPTTAEAIAAELGLLDGRRVAVGPELDWLDDPELAALLDEVSVFARVTPEHKARIVAALQAAGHVVAVTGDGANDAPAIRRADVGVALGARATAAARDAADLVVTDDRIETIIDAIIEGRALWVSVRDALAVLLGGNLGEIGFALGAGLFTRTGSPLQARQLLLVNLLTDIVPAMALALRPPPRATPERLLREGPDVSLGPALTRDIVIRAVATGGSATAAWVFGRATGTRRHASTVALVGLVGSQLAQTAVAGWRSPLVVGSTVVSAATLAAMVQTPVVSHFFGCTPLGPVGWAGGVSAAAAGAGGAALASALLGRPGDPSEPALDVTATRR